MKIKYLVVSAVLITATLGFGINAQAQTQTNIQALIAQIQAQIQSLMQQIQQLLAQQQGGQTWCHTFNTNLGVGSNSEEVEQLVGALSKENLFSTARGSYYNFDESLADAVIKFQQKYGITPLSGYVGPKTRTKLNSLYGCSTFPTPTPIPTQPLITVSSPNTNSSVSFPLTVTGSIGSNWGRFEGTAGNAQLYFYTGSSAQQMGSSVWQQIGTPVSIVVDSWTTPITNFHFTINFNNSGVGLPNGTRMKIVLTEENASGLGTPDTFELPIVLNSTAP